MGIDANIYQSIRPAQIDMPSPLDTAQKMMSLSQLAMQQRAMGVQLQNQQALAQAYQNNVDGSGNVNHQGVLSDLAKSSPMAAMEYAPKVAAMQKSAAEARKAAAEAAHEHLSLVVPAYDYLLKLPDDQARQAYHGVLKQLADQGVPVNNAEPEFNRAKLQQEYAIGSQLKEQLDTRKTQAETENKQAETAMIPGKMAHTQAETAKVYSDIGQAPAKLNAELYGSRSPNAELTSQYNADAKPIRGSQLAMQQMIDNYQHPSPQGDASLILNAFKIKFPNAPDVNSLKELSESQAASDHWKQIAHKALSGGLDTGTRDNLMRDGVSTYRANVESLRGIQERYNTRAKFQNVNDPTLTAEPAIDKTYGTAMELQDKIGPYVPPTERPGVIGSVKKFASQLMGGEEKTASAAEPQQPKYRAPGATVSEDELAKYAMKHKMKASDAKTYLRSHGYAVD